MNKKSNIITLSAAIFVALIAIGGVTYYSFAADSNATSTNMFGKFRHMDNLTIEQQTQLTAEMEAKQAEIKAKHDAIQSSLNANDYDAWVKAVGENASILQKINKDNFSKYVEANSYMEKAHTIMAELGVDGKGMMSMGFGGKKGEGGLRGGGCGMMKNISPNNTNTTN